MMSDSVPVVTLRHIRKARMCMQGARAFFERHGLDWAAFREQGLPADVVEATGDAMAIEVARVARAEAGEG